MTIAPRTTSQARRALRGLRPAALTATFALLAPSGAWAQPAELPQPPAPPAQQPAPPAQQPAAPAPPTQPAPAPEAPAAPPAGDAEAPPEQATLPPPPPEPEVLPPAPDEPTAEAPGAEGEAPKSGGMVWDEAPATTEAESEGPKLETEDELDVPNYTPGYRRHMGLGTPPHMPRYGSFPGGVAPSYGVPIDGQEWTFKFSGYMNASLQFSVDDRERPSDGQTKTVFHTPPQTIDEWGHFTSTSSVPGNWVNMNFIYGNQHVQATVSIDTWNPSRPTTYYAIGSQYFINNAFLTYRPEPIGAFRLHVNAGFFGSSYGTLGQYGNGIYTNPIAGSIRGVGETTVIERDVSENWTGIVEHGVMAGDRTGKYPDEVIAQQNNGWKNPIFPASWIHHAHLGVRKKGDPEILIQGHYITNWSQEDRGERDFDNPDTDQVNEADLEDGRITVYSLSATLKDSIYGFLGVAGAIIDAHDAFTIKGLTTYGGTGEEMTDRWLGVTTGGSGEIYVAGINYNVSLGKIVAYPTPFPGDGPDIELNMGYHIGTTRSDFGGWDGRTRQRYGIDGMYTLLKWFGVGLRVDRVIPNGKRPEETFHVLAPRLLFRTDWNAREQITLRYVKWFYGSDTRNEGTGLRTPDRLDDQLWALNFNMWW